MCQPRRASSLDSEGDAPLACGQTEVRPPRGDAGCHEATWARAERVRDGRGRIRARRGEGGPICSSALGRSTTISPGALSSSQATSSAPKPGCPLAATSGTPRSPGRSSGPTTDPLPFTQPGSLNRPAAAAPRPGAEQPGDQRALATPELTRALAAPHHRPTKDLGMSNAPAAVPSSGRATTSS